MKGEGAVCWDKCPNGTVECGALCIQPSVNCALYLVNVVGGAAAAAMDIATKGINKTITGNDIITNVNNVAL
jgi:hypothetical protein